jgi:predicted DNA binding CopG/RHH family protein
MSKASFEWDVEKDLENRAKHGVSFAQAQYAFADRQRVIAADLSHSQREKRYYCFGTVGAVFSRSDLRTVGVPPAYSVPAIGGKASKSMNAKIKYTDEPLGDLKVIPDFLPAPEELAFRDDTVKVTITLSRSSVEFFKREAKKHHTQYQKMIRRLLDVYTQKHQQPLTRKLSRRAEARG